jgi:putative DNA primase/helicase
MMSANKVAAALGGRVVGRYMVLGPGPGHSKDDRSLAVKLDPGAADGFVTFSHAGDDWRQCRDHVRALLKLPAWEPGDGQHRRIPTGHIDKWDVSATAIDAEKEQQALDDDQLARAAYARRVWDAGTDPRGTLGEKYLNEQRRLSEMRIPARQITCQPC